MLEGFVLVNTLEKSILQIRSQISKEKAFETEATDHLDLNGFQGDAVGYHLC